MRTQKQINFAVVAILLIVACLVGLGHAPLYAASRTWQASSTFQGLSAVAFAADGQRGWAVGERGTILATTDGGAHWANQASPTSNYLLAVAFAADGQRGWAVGGGGTILATTDGGAHWANQASLTPHDLGAVAFAADGQRGWAVGERGTILATTDGGAHWANQASPTSHSLFAVAFAADGQRGWAVGEIGTILATTDGGVHWANQASPTYNYLQVVAFAADGQRGWAVGESGTILATTDGGAHWANQASPTSSNDLRAVAFAADGQRGWALGERGTILATTDGGAHWANQASPTSNYLLAVAFAADGQRGWAVGESGTILATTDGGAHWANQASLTSHDLGAVAFAADGQRGWAVGERGTILATTDGGAHWANQASPTSHSLFAVAFAADGQRGWAVGEIGTILATTDGGVHWANQASPTYNYLQVVAFAADGQRGWAVGERGTILATTDGGAHWANQASLTSNSLNAAAFAVDGQRGWAVGGGGTILATTDGGAHWANQASPTSNYLLAVAFAADGQRGWAVGESGTILATTDGGAHWANQASPTSSNDLRAVAFAADGQRGWAVGEIGTILATTDGGVHWANQASPTSNYLRAVAFAADGQRGWAVGESGTILLTVELPSLESESISIDQRAMSENVDFSFRVSSDLKLPVWGGEVQAKTDKRDWTFVGIPTIRRESGGNMLWHFSWRPEDHDFRSGDSIHYQVLFYAGALNPISSSLGTMVFDPWWARVWRQHRTEIVASGAPASLFLVYAGGFLLVLLVAPASLARIGSAPLDAIPTPTGNVAFFWSLLRKLWEGVLLLWLCRNSRVRRAWTREYAAGKTKLGDLGKFARERFVTEPEVLDAWVSARVTKVRNALESLDLFEQRRNFVPLPVRVGSTLIVERPSSAMLRETFGRSRAVACIVGGGGGGKSTLACAIARWAMSDDPAERLMPQRMIPLFIFQDTTDLRAAVPQALRRMLGEEELPGDLIQGLLARQRLLVIIDALSEREPGTQQHVEGIFAQASVYNAMVITSRREPRLGEVERTLIYPLLLDQKQIVPFIIDYVAKLDNADALQGGRTLLQLGDRILELAEKDASSTSVTPLLVKLFIESAMSRARPGTMLEGLPHDVPEIFVDYLKRVYASPIAGSSWAAEDEFIRAARILARVSLGARLVPSDFSVEDAKLALHSSNLSGETSALLESFVSGGVIERRNAAGEPVLRFALDPVAEYLAAIQFVIEQRPRQRAEVMNRLDALTQVGGYPKAFEGYLKAIAICYRAYSSVFKLPEVLFPWETEGATKSFNA